MGRVVVVGAGVIGLWCAYELRRRGAAVTVLDKGPEESCSTGNAGWVTPVLSEPLPAPGLVSTSLRWMLRSDSPLYIRPAAVPALAPWLYRFWRHCNPRDYEAGMEALAGLNRRTMALYDALAADGVSFEMRRAELLLVFLERRNAEHLLAGLAPLERLGYPAPRLLDKDELRDVQPGLAADAAAGILAPGERLVRPESLLQGLRERLAALEAEMMLNAQVTGFRRRGAQVTAVETGAGAIEADQVLVAAGAWSGGVCAKLGLPLPVQAGKGYSLTYERGAGPGAGAGPGGGPRRMLYLYEVRVAYSPFASGFRLAGTMELSGINQRLEPRRVEAIRLGAARFLGGAGLDGEGRPWVGMRPITPDGLPLLGRLPGTDNAFVATGHGMLGVTLAPATAAAVADLMTGREPGTELRPFDPGRFLRVPRTA